jgi:UDP-N-acetyl-L-fucosamine synthase
MRKVKIVSLVGTRPEIIRLSRVLSALDSSSVFEHRNIHTGQNYDYELNNIFYEDLGLKNPDYILNSAKKSAASTIGQIIMDVEPILKKEKPDALLVLGDTNSCLGAIPAKKMRIPVFHMEAGNRCFDIRVPEETNRKIVDHIADINLPYSTIAREYLLREGIPSDRIIKTGSPMYEVLNYYKQKILDSNILKLLNIKKGEYFVVSAHREENIESKYIFFKLIESLNTLAEKFKYPIIFSTHPRTRNRLSREKVKLNPLIEIAKPFSFTDYNSLQMNSFATLSDSGTISEESSILNFRALNIREAHERPEAMEEASVIMVGLNPGRILTGIELLKRQNTGSQRNIHSVEDYSKNNVSEKILRIILSYIDYINNHDYRK